MERMAFQVGQRVGEYRIQRVLGRGGLGAVYEAVHLISQRSDAMKVLLPEQIGVSDMAERFRREIQLLAALSHPNISGLHNAFHFEDQIVMIMELVHGEDLRTLSRRVRIEIPVLMGYGVQVLTALGYAHARGVVHRDIKPANIMVTPEGVVKVLDFGIAVSSRSDDLTAVGAMIGSPTHMSPEQIRGEKATPQSDIYSVGVTLYELIAGEPPLGGASTYELMMAHMNVVPVPLHVRRPDIPVGLSGVIAKALEKDPAQRFRSAEAFQTALQTAELHPAMQAVTQIPAASWQRMTTDELHRPLTTVSALPLEPVIRHLAVFIGPIAKIVVNRLAKTATSLDQLYAESAKQIDGESDRQKFLRTRPR